VADQIKDPSSLGVVKFPVLSSVILTIAALLLTLVFHYHKEWRESMNFGIAAGALAAGALGAYYVGRALAQTIQQRSEFVTEQKIARAFEFHRRWNDPTLAQIKANFRELIESGKAHIPDHVEELIEADKAKRTAVVEVLNFFEELAIAVHTGVADNDTLARGFRAPLNTYHATLQPWIKQHRSSKKRPTMWIELDRLVERWNS
jgi:hypothetical protein